MVCSRWNNTSRDKVLQREVGERQAEIACIVTGNNPNLMLQDREGHIPGSHGMHY